MNRKLVLVVLLGLAACSNGDRRESAPTTTTAPLNLSGTMTLRIPKVSRMMGPGDAKALVAMTICRQGPAS